MKLYEYQAKQLLHARRIAVPPGRVTDSAERAGEIFVELGGKPVAVKAQVHAGGRGKGGGIKIAKTEKECQSIAESMLGSNLVTPQTGKAGLRVREAWIEPAAAIRSEYYAGIALDRDARKLVFMVCSEGGVEIEQVAYRSPEKIFKEHIDTALGLQVFQARRLAFKLGLKDNVHQQAVQLFLNLYKTFVSLDCSLLEINPLVVTQDERLLALDVKMNIDDNALYRQTQLTEAYDPALDLAPLERKAYEFNLNYVKLDGHVGCMVNGAGLAMATMDLIKLAGASPANFLDVGGGASVKTIENGFRILLSDSNVKVVFVNIFGGIVRCDRVAEGIIQAAGKIGVYLPFVIRLSGTNAQEAAKIIKQSPVPFSMAPSMEKASELVMDILAGEQS